MTTEKKPTPTESSPRERAERADLGESCGNVLRILRESANVRATPEQLDEMRRELARAAVKVEMLARLHRDEVDRRPVNVCPKCGNVGASLATNAAGVPTLYECLARNCHTEWEA